MLFSSFQLEMQLLFFLQTFSLSPKSCNKYSIYKLIGITGKKQKKKTTTFSSVHVFVCVCVLLLTIGFCEYLEHAGKICQFHFRISEQILYLVSGNQVQFLLTQLIPNSDQVYEVFNFEVFLFEFQSGFCPNILNTCKILHLKYLKHI